MNFKEFTTENLGKIAPLTEGNTQKMFEGELAQRNISLIDFLAQLKGLEEFLPLIIKRQVDNLYMVDRKWYLKQEEGIRYTEGFLFQEHIDLFLKDYKFGCEGSFGNLVVEGATVKYDGKTWTFATFMELIAC